MTRIHGKLSALAVKHTVKRGLYADGGGLYLQVARNGSRSWVLRYRLDGRRRYCGLGSLLRVTLAEARQRAGEARAVLMAGNDPIAIKQGQRTATRLNAARAMTFEKAAAQYIDSHRAGWSPKSVSQWTGTLKQHVFPVFGSLPVQDIDTPLVMKVIEPIWATKTETASRVRGRIENILDWAVTRGFRTTGDNPARWDGHIENLLPAATEVATVEHFAAMPFATVPEFMAGLRQDRTLAARGLEFAILTAARSSEILQADWREIDLSTRVWTIPAARMKADKEHRVPLSGAAVALLNALPGARSGFRLPRQQARPANEPDAIAAPASSHGPDRRDRPRVSQRFHRLGARADHVPARGYRNELGAQGRQCGRAELPPHRSVRSPSRADVCVGQLLRRRSRARR
jgi:integrase